MTVIERAPDVELRLAVVCYGGVSLAVYMHGVTKELQKLVSASRRFDEIADLNMANPFPGGTSADTEHWYFEALRGLAIQGRRVSVAVDVIAGTSAGGINGIVLAKAIALDASQDKLKRLWIDEGDLRTLLRAPRLRPLKLQVALAVAKLLFTFRSPTSPLRGERMSRLLVDAIRDLDRPAGGQSLLPEGGTLDLYVTATDLNGFEVLVPTGAGGASQRDRAHAQVLQFQASRDQNTDFGATGTLALAFAARATSSFPGAFAPVSIDSFGRELAGTGAPVDLAHVARHFRESYAEGGKNAADAYLVDGGLLDNAPFDLVIDAISRKRAQTEVIRRILYVQPDPDRALGAPARDDQASAEAPGWLAGLWQSLAGAKGSHALLRDLLRLRDMNLQVAEIGAIAAQQMDQVSTTVAAVLADVRPAGRAGALWDVGDATEVQAVSDRMHAAARAALGAGFPSYCRLKVLVAGQRLAAEMAMRFIDPPDSSRSSFVRAAIGAWARARVEWVDPDPGRLLAMLGPVDVPYRERRLHFLLAGIGEFYRRLDAGDSSPGRADLNALKAQAWDLMDELRQAPGRAVRALTEQDLAFLNRRALERVLLQDPEQFAADHAAEFTALFTRYSAALKAELGDGSTPLWQGYRDLTAQWEQEHRVRLLTRYLGFPLWDGLIFPTVALAQLPQFTPIGVTQCSPLAAGALRKPEGGKLKGVSLHHFGGFLDAEWRENDYLWGRLDGAEILLRTLQASLTPGQGGAEVVPADPAEALRLAGGQACRGALLSVLDRESDLRRVTGLINLLRTELGDSARPA